MNRCPNCNAELTAKPCPGCGWPDTTQPSDADRARVKRQLAATREGKQSGCNSCLVVLAVLATGAAAWFYRVGAANNWTSDGPGILLFYLGTAGFGLLAVCLWAALAFDMILPFLPGWLRFWFEDDYS